MRKPLLYEDLGLVFAPNQGVDSLRYSQVPTPILLTENIIRVYLAGRNERNETFIYTIDVASDNPTQIIDIQPDPVLSAGRLGCFDENGTMPSCAFFDNGTIRLFYSGWSIRKTVPYNNLTGCAVLEKFRKFKRLSAGPVLGQSIVDPLSATSPWVLKHNDTYFMFYCSGIDWLMINGKLEHTYDIKIATSANAVNWLPTGNIAIKQRGKKEAITRPTVIASNDGFHMWFCYRQSEDFRGGRGSYKIGYAYSKDLLNWERANKSIKFKNEISSHWAQEMQAYPAAIETRENKYLFYNGNGFGKSGFGVIKVT